MEPSPVDGKMEQAMLELSKKMAGKDKTEQANMLMEFGRQNYGADMNQPTPQIVLSDAQARMIIEGGIEAAKKAAADEAAKIERKYDLAPTEARAIAEDGVSKELRARARFDDDCAQVAKSLRAIARHATNRAQPGELQKAYEEDFNYLKKSGRQTRGNTMTVGTGADGGFTSPETWNTMLYENLARVSLLRKYAFWFPLIKGNIMRLPKITAGVTAETTAEAGTPNTYKPTIAQVTWTLKKLTAMTTPFSIELMEDATPELVAMLTKIVVIELNRKEDEVCFKTSDSGWTDLLDTTTNRVYLGGSSTSGKTLDTTATFDDMARMYFQLGEQYTPDEDVQGSGLLANGQAAYWVNKALIQTLLFLKGTTNEYLWGRVNDLAMGRRIWGQPVRRVLSLPSSATAGTMFAVFGDLSARWVAYKPGFYIDVFNQGVVKDAAGTDVNLAMTSQYALRVNEILDIQTIDDNAFSRLSTAAS